MADKKLPFDQDRQAAVEIYTCLLCLVQMADPLTALIHAVQVMNFLKTLIMKTLQEREEAAANSRLFSSSMDSVSSSKDDPHSSNSNRGSICCEETQDGCGAEEPTIGDFLKPDALDRLEFDIEEKFWSFQQKSEAEEEYQSISGLSTPVGGEVGNLKTGYENEEVEGILDRLSLRKGVKKLCRHPIFHFSKPVKKPVEPLGL